MKLDYIEFGFENCEIIRIDGKYVGDFCVKDFETQVARFACNDISKTEFCNHFEIEISKNANEIYEPPFTVENKEYKFDRIIRYNDITSIKFQLSNQYAETEDEKCVEKYYYWVDYDTDGDESLGADNANQKTYISNLGNLYLVIDKKCKSNMNYLFDIFDLEMINDKDTMEFRFNMCDVE